MSLLLLLVFALIACQNSPLDVQTANEEQSANISRLNTQLTLNDAVLEQSDNSKKLAWKIKAKRTTYTDDRKIAYIEDIKANLLQNQQIILKIKGAKGEVREEGKLIILKEKIVANDVRNDTVLQGNMIQWRPLENLLEIQGNLQGNQPNLRLTANTAKYFTDTETLELTGEVVVNYLNPDLILESDRLIWKISEQQIIADNPIKIVSYHNQTVTDRLVANQSTVDLKNYTVTCRDNVELTSLKPQLQIATNSATWNYQKRSITSDRPIQVKDRNQDLTITGNQGQIDLQAEIVTLKDGVKAIDNQEKASFYSQQIVWQIINQEVIATGNVIYNKTQPKIDLTGDKAVIDLKNNKALVTSDQPQTKPVVSVVEN